jgi:hypothetical protein
MSHKTPFFLSTTIEKETVTILRPRSAQMAMLYFYIVVERKKLSFSFTVISNK